MQTLPVTERISEEERQARTEAMMQWLTQCKPLLEALVAGISTDEIRLQAFDLLDDMPVSIVDWYLGNE